MSLYQKGSNCDRKDGEQELFEKALSRMHLWYFHPRIPVFKLTQMPEGYPEGFRHLFPEGCTPNIASYADRGWVGRLFGRKNFTGYSVSAKVRL